MGEAESAPEPSPEPSRTTGWSSDSLITRLLPLWQREKTAPSDASIAPPAPVDTPKLGLSNLARMRVDDVAVPKAEIAAVDVECSREDLISLFRSSGFTRLPVYEGTLDNPLGMVHLKDLALKFGFNGHNAQFNLRSLLRPMLYAPPSMPIGVLLQKMQTQGMHMALVIDEYGGTDGLVTIEDLIEQVIGEIEDEHDEAEVLPWREEAPGCFLAL
ncbi:MAG: CBS domain-containing protein, partial [Mangrovicoccus sp.]